MTLKRCAALGFSVVLGMATLFAVGACNAEKGGEAKASETKAAEKKPIKVFVDTSTLKPAPDFAVTDLQGNQKTMADYAGKIVILDFWATWCGPCKMEIPHFIKLYDEYRAQGLEIVGVSLDAGGAKDVEPFARAKKINYPMLLGNNKIVSDYGGVRGIPTAFVITQDGKIYRKYVGYRAPDVFESDIRALLGLGPKG